MRISRIPRNAIFRNLAEFFFSNGTSGLFGAPKMLDAAPEEHVNRLVRAIPPKRANGGTSFSAGKLRARIRGWGRVEWGTPLLRQKDREGDGPARNR